MNLKKSDKIIAIIGVVILIVAAIGIIMYAPGDKEDDNVEPPAEPINFDILVEPTNVPLIDNPEYPISDNLINLFGRFDRFDKSEYIPVNISSRGVKSVNIFVEYNDQRSGALFGLLKNVRADTLTVSILDKDGTEVMAPVDIKGNGSISYDISVNNLLGVRSISALDEDKAKEKLDLELMNLSDEMVTYTVKVTLNEKERVLRPIHFLLEKLLDRDTFSIQVTYDQEVYDIKSVENDGYNGDGKMGQSESGNNNYDKQRYEYLDMTNKPLSKS